MKKNMKQNSWNFVPKMFIFQKFAREIGGHKMVAVVVDVVVVVIVVPFFFVHFFFFQHDSLASLGIKDIKGIGESGGTLVDFLWKTIKKLQNTVESWIWELYIHLGYEKTSKDSRESIFLEQNLVCLFPTKILTYKWFSQNDQIWR